MYDIFPMTFGITLLQCRFHVDLTSTHIDQASTYKISNSIANAIGRTLRFCSGITY